MESVSLFILKCFYFMLPAYFANMAPVIVRKDFRELAVPLDMGAKLEGERLLGNNKTYRGLIFGIIFAAGTAYVQFTLYENDLLESLAITDYSNWLFLGILMGLGAIGGDAVKSFFKRRAGKKPGERFFPWDQVDFVIGALLLSAIVVRIPLLTVVVAILLSILLHIAVNHLAFYLKIRKEKW